MSDLSEPELTRTRIFATPKYSNNIYVLYKYNPSNYGITIENIDA